MVVDREKEEGDNPSHNHHYIIAYQTTATAVLFFSVLLQMRIFAKCQMRHVIELDPFLIEDWNRSQNATAFVAAIGEHGN